jgi:hypothetical protein
MRHIILILTFAIFIIPCSQSQVKKGDGFSNFWSSFKKAVLAKDKKAVFSMSHLPLDIGVETETQFYDNFDTFFDAEVLKGFKLRSPQKVTSKSDESVRDLKGQYFIKANYCFFTFKKINDKWMFVTRGCPG